jgi:pantetheine-phosphate adenylyltransferase
MAGKQRGSAGAGGARVAVYPGSFDPVTRGHLDIVERARGLFDTLYVAVLENSAKEALFDVDERRALLAAELEGLEGVKVVTFEGLTVDLAVKVEAGWIVRGLRSAADAADELPMARTNRLCGKRPLETVLIPSGSGVEWIASRLVREIAAAGGVLSEFVTPRVEAALRKRFGAKRRGG